MGAGTGDPTVTMWEFLYGDRWTTPGAAGKSGLGVIFPLRRQPKYELLLPQIVEMADAGSGIDLISRALGVGTELVRDALHLHRTGETPPSRIDGRRRRQRRQLRKVEPKYQRLAAEVDRRRRAGGASTGCLGK